MTAAAAEELARAAEAVTKPLELVTRRIDGAEVEATRTYPGYHHGNRVVLDAAPAARALPGWLERYRTLFAWRRAANPAVIAWYDACGAALPAAPAGGHIERIVALLAPDGARASVDDGMIRFVRVDSDAGWRAVAALESAAFPEFGAFNDWRVAAFRALAERGRGGFYALADADHGFVASAGGFSDGTVGRYASVLTAAPFRGRGYARRLVVEILRIVRERARSVVIMAEHESAGASLYGSLGFAPFVELRSLVVGPAPGERRS